jgi:hypothetical protein
MIASIFWLLTPIWVLLFIVLLVGTFAILSRIKGGRYVRPIVAGMMKIPLLGRGLRKASESALERSNPMLASAVKKLERAGAMRDPQRLQKALSLLTAAERRAWMEAADQQQQQQGSGSEISNRQIRRQLERRGLGQGQAQVQKGKGRPKPKRGLLGRRKKEEDEPQYPRRGQRPGRNRKKRRRR